MDTHTSESTEELRKAAQAEQDEYDFATRPMIAASAERMTAFAAQRGERKAISQALELIHVLALHELAPEDRTAVYAMLGHAQDYAMLAYESVGPKASRDLIDTYDEMRAVLLPRDPWPRHFGYKSALLAATIAAARADWREVAEKLIGDLPDVDAADAQRIVVNRLEGYFVVPSEAADAS